MTAIAAAFVKAQRAFEPARKTSNNPHFKSQYASLDVCIDAVLTALNDNGIALIQRTHECMDGVMVETLFLHESGEELSGGFLHVPAAKLDPQGYGSALTYARRYSLLAACGIAPEDDDGNAATKTASNLPNPPQGGSGESSAHLEPRQRVTPPQAKMLKAKMAAAKFTVGEAKDLLFILGVERIEDIAFGDVDKAIQYIESHMARAM